MEAVYHSTFQRKVDIHAMRWQLEESSAQHVTSLWLKAIPDDEDVPDVCVQHIKGGGLRSSNRDVLVSRSA